MVKNLKLIALSVLFFLSGLLFGGCNKWAETEQVYYLPYEAGTTHYCIQGNYGRLSHTQLKKVAIDLLMLVGTPLIAPCDGYVVDIKMVNQTNEHCSDTSVCPNNELTFWDPIYDIYIRIAHLNYDSSPKVFVGQYVERGQFLAFSGNSGNSASPHAHIEAFRYKQDDTKEYLIIRFADVNDNNGIPKEGYFYTSANEPV